MDPDKKIVINEGTEVPATLVTAMDGTSVPETVIAKIKKSERVDLDAKEAAEIRAMITG